MSDENDDQPPKGWVDYSDRHIRIDTGFYEIVVKDDREDLETLEDSATRLMSEAESAVERMKADSDPSGMHR